MGSRRRDVVALRRAFVLDRASAFGVVVVVAADDLERAFFADLAFFTRGIVGQPSID